MTLTFEQKVHFKKHTRGRKQMAVGALPGHVPHISRLMALAIRFEGMIQRGEVRDYAELARLGHVSRARVTQIMNLLNLAPDIQEAILFLPPVEAGRDPIKEWEVRPVAGEAEWKRQRDAFKPLKRKMEPAAW